MVYRRRGYRRRPIRRRRFTRSYPRKRYSRYRRRGISRYRKRTTTMRRAGPTGLPVVLKTRMRFSDDNFNLSTTGGGGYTAHYVFRGNSIYDPDYTSVGIYPYGYAELTAFYKAYWVSGSKIKINFHTSESVNAVPFIKTFVWANDTFASPTYTDPADLRAGTQVPIRSRVFNRDSLLSDSNKGKYSWYRSTKSVMPNHSVPTYTVIGDSPNHKWYWHVYTDTQYVLNGGAAPANITFDCTIDFYVVLTQPRQLNAGIV